MTLTVGTEVVKRHIFKATLQQWGMMSGWVCKCKLLCTVNVECERMAGQRTNNNHSHNDATIKSIRWYILTQRFIFPAQSPKNVLHLHLQSYHHPETGSTTICCCSDHGLHYLPRWSESVGISPRGVRRILLPSITDKYSPVKRLFPLEWWHKNKSLISAAGPGRAAQPLLCLLNPSGSTICLALYLLASKTSLVHSVQWGSAVVWGHEEIMKELQWAQFAGLWCAQFIWRVAFHVIDNKILSCFQRMRAYTFSVYPPFSLNDCWL